MPEGSAELPVPYVRSGPNKGRIKNPLVAHEAYNTIETLRIKEARKQKHKVYKKPFFEKHGDNAALDYQAAKSVQLEEEKQIDELTGLNNQKSYFITGKHAIQELKNGDHKALGVIRMDLDYFSWLNDYIGAHYLGDIYLSVTGEMLSDSIRKGKDKAFRAGGDEFAVLIKDSFTYEQYDSIIQRYHYSVNRKILAKTMNIILSGDDFIDIGDGRTEREGTVAIKEFLVGLMNLKYNIPNEKGIKAQDHFLEHARGHETIKKAFLQKLNDSDLEKFRQYLEDTRVFNDIKNSSPDLEARINLEKEATQTITTLLGNLTVSTAGIYISKDNVRDFQMIDRKTDSLVQAIKSGGGGDYTTSRIT